MPDIARRIIDIALFRAGPQDLPASWNLLYTLLGLDLLLIFLAASMTMDSGLAVLRVALSTLLTLALLYSALSLWRLRGRFCQTATAVFGTDVLITLLALPLVLSIGRPDRQEASIADFGLLALNVWSVGILGHILRHALEIPLVNGVLLAFGYALGMVFLLQALIG